MIEWRPATRTVETARLLGEGGGGRLRLDGGPVRQRRRVVRDLDLGAVEEPQRA